MQGSHRISREHASVFAFPAIVNHLFPPSSTMRCVLCQLATKKADTHRFTVAAPIRQPIRGMALVCWKSSLCRQRANAMGMNRTMSNQELRTSEESRKQKLGCGTWSFAIPSSAVAGFSAGRPQAKRALVLGRESGVGREQAARSSGKASRCECGELSPRPL